MNRKMNNFEDPLLKFCYIMDPPNLELDFETMQLKVAQNFLKPPNKNNDFYFDGYIWPFLTDGDIWKNEAADELSFQNSKFERVFAGAPNSSSKDSKWLSRIVDLCLSNSHLDMSIHEIPNVLDLTRPELNDTESKRVAPEGSKRGVNHFNLIQILGNPAKKDQPVRDLKPRSKSRRKLRSVNKVMFFR